MVSSISIRLYGISTINLDAKLVCDIRWTSLIRNLGNKLTELGNREENKDEKWKTLVQHSKVNHSRIILNTYKNKFILAGV